jgi:hypothetical protein
MAGRSNNNIGTSTVVVGDSIVSTGGYSAVFGFTTNNSADYSNVSGYKNVNSGISSLVAGAQATNTGSYSTVLGFNNINVADVGLTTGYANTNQSYVGSYFGRYAEVASTASSTSWVTSDPLFVIGNGSTPSNRLNALTVLKDGNVGVGTSTPNYKLEVIGDINAVGNVRANGVILTSDARFKQEVQTIGTSTLDKFNQINPVSYTWNGLGQEQGGIANQTQYGFLAQEVELIFPELVSTRPDGYKGVNYFGFIAMIVEAVKEMGSKIDDLMTRIIKVETDVAELRTRVQTLESQSGVTYTTPAPTTSIPTSTTSDPSVDWSDPTASTSSSLSCQAGTQYDSTSNSCVVIPSTDTTATTTPTVESTPEPNPITNPTTTTDPTPVVDPVVTDPATTTQ